MYVKEARQRRIAIKTFTIPMHDVDRAIADSEEGGFVKIHVREGSDRILGAAAVARHAGELINSIWSDWRAVGCTAEALLHHQQAIDPCPTKT